MTGPRAQAGKDDHLQRATKSGEQLHQGVINRLHVSEADAQALIDLVRAANVEPIYAPSGTTTDGQLLMLENNRIALRRKVSEFITERAVDAYRYGADEAIDKDRLRSYRARTVVLLLVVLAVVAMPLVAMFIGLEPQVFGAYISPVTAIAGTVIGYWFGATPSDTSRRGNQ
jgi:hypothetical protein